MRGIVVHSLADARAGLAAAASLGVPVRLQSAPDAAGYAGVAWFERLIAAASAEVPDAKYIAVLDCGDAAGYVLAAVRWLGQPDRVRLALCFRGDAATAQRLQEIATAAGLDLVRELEPGLDLRGERDPPAACRAWLAETAPAAATGSP